MMLAAARMCGMPLADMLRLPVLDIIAWGGAAFAGVRALLRGGGAEERIRKLVESDELPITWDRSGRDG